jgi:hypothetical protein
MRSCHALSAVVLAFSLAAFLGFANTGSAADQPIAEAGLVSLIDLKIDDEVIIARIKKAGLAFAADDAALKRLADKGASEAVLKAVREAGTKKPAASGAAVIAYADVLKLLQLEIPEEQILKRLAKSPTVFTLSAEQVAELKGAGATDTLIKALTAPREAPAEAAELITNFAIVLDCSLSMEKPVKEGESKMEAAKRVVSDLIKKIPAGLKVTFVIYGHEVFGKADDPRNCQAVKVARELAPLDAAGQAELVKFVEGLKPTGGTPIALALKTAGEELAKDKDAFAGIVLVTDGLESCKGNPNEEVANLLDSLKLSFGVNVVGLGVSDAEDAALKALADSGKGKYYSAGDADALADSLGAIAKELEVKAKPAEVVNTSRRAVKILKPAVEMPEMAEIVLIEHEYPVKEARLYKKGSITKYDEEIRIPSSTAKYDLVWYPKEGEAILLVKGLQLTERKVVNIKPEDYVGFIKVNGKGTPKSIHAAVEDAPSVLSFSTQRAKKFGEIMVVPAGSYDVYLEDNAIEEGLKVEPGKLYELE